MKVLYTGTVERSTGSVERGNLGVPLSEPTILSWRACASPFLEPACACTHTRRDQAEPMNRRLFGRSSPSRFGDTGFHRSSVESWICEAYGAVYTGSPPGLPRQHPAMKCNEQRRPHSPKGARPSPGTLCVRCCVLFFPFLSLSLSLSRALARNLNRTPWSSLPAKGEMVAALIDAEEGCQKRVIS